MSDETLTQLRTRIDQVDADLVRLLAQRVEITDLVGLHKAANGLPAADHTREAELIARLGPSAADAGIEPAFCEQRFRLIVDGVVRRHLLIAERA